jgi:hypothetical protein
MKNQCGILLGLIGLLWAGPASFGEDLSSGAPVPAAVASSCAVGLGPVIFLITNGQAGIANRLLAVNRLERDLSHEQIIGLYSFLRALPGPGETNWEGLNALKNDLLSRLRDQFEPPAGLTGTLIEIYRDRAQDPVARDYALQHLVTWYEQGAADAPDAKARIQTTLEQAAQENTSIAGTALLGLHRLVASDSAELLAERHVFRGGGGRGSNGQNQFPDCAAVKGVAISQMALRMLGATNLAPASRVTAIQVCAEREIVEALPAIQVLAQAEGGTALRISAIAALGYLGGPEQAVFLQRLEAEQNQALRPAIEGARRRLQSRLRNNPDITQNVL